MRKARWCCGHCGQYSRGRSWNCQTQCSVQHKVCSSLCARTPTSPDSEEIESELQQKFGAEFLEEYLREIQSINSTLSDRAPQSNVLPPSSTVNASSSEASSRLQELVHFSRSLPPSQAKALLEDKGLSGRSSWNRESVLPEEYSLIPTSDWIALLDGTECGKLRGQEPCSGKMSFLKHLAEGRFEIVALQCQQCSAVVYVYNSPPERVGQKSDGRSGFRQINVQAVASHLFAGGTMTSYLKSNLLDAFGKSIPEGSWHRIENFIWNVVKKVLAIQNSEMVAQLKKREVLVLAGDGAWAHWRNLIKVFTLFWMPLTGKQCSGIS